MKSVEAKVVVLGSSGVGKTCVIIRQIHRSFDELMPVNPTIGASFFTCKLAVDDYTLRLQVWDTAGQERFKSMAPMYYRHAGAALLVFDLTCNDSFQACKHWVEELQRNVESHLIMILIGNKSDLTEERVVDKNAAQAYAESIGASYFETSAVSADGIEDAFFALSLELIKYSEQQRESQATYGMNNNELKQTRAKPNSGHYKNYYNINRMDRFPLDEKETLPSRPFLCC